jgi:hypothetical protein
MAYKIKSMLKQTSGTGLSANYYLKQELNKFTDGDSEVVKPSNKGKSIAKVTEKFTTPEIIKAQIMSYLPLRNQKDTDRERDEKKQIRKAGRDEKKQIRKAGKEAAKNAEVDFVKATPMGSDYFSLMAATAENLASRGAEKRKARKAAKREMLSLKREMLSEGRDAKSIERKGVKKIQSTSPTPSSSKAEIRVPKKTDEFKTLPTTPDTLKAERAERAERLKRGNKALFKKVDESMNAYNQQKNEETKRLKKTEQSPTSKEGFMSFTRSEGREDISKDDLKIPKSKTNNAVGITSDNLNKIERAYKLLGMPLEAKVVREAYNKQQMAEDEKRTGTKIPSWLSVSKSEAANFDANLKQANQEKAKKIESQKQAEIEAAKKIVGLQMTGDGFNKGMSRKNKYKK